MHKKYVVRSRIYFVLAALGLITAWVLNGIASMQGANYLAAWFETPVDWVLSVDLLIVALAVAVFMIYEANRLGMKRVWLYFLLSGITALAFTFPLFIEGHENQLDDLVGHLHRSELQNLPDGASELG
jgi:hypothetical protein